MGAVTGGAPQDRPGLCIDDNTGLLYSVGSGEIETCNATSGTCSQQTYSNLELVEVACEYFNGNIYVFGGKTSGDNIHVDTIWKCDPETGDSCTDITDGILAARAGMKAVKIECFDN